MVAMAAAGIALAVLGFFCEWASAASAGGGGPELVLRAADMGHPQANIILREVVRQNTDPTPLHFCAQNGLEKAARTLLELGIDAEGLKPGSNYTPLHTAAHFNQVEVAKVLVLHGANVDLAVPRTNSEAADSHKRGPLLTPILTAIDGGCEAFVKYLLEEAHAKVNVDMMHYAVMRGNINIVKMLLKHLMSEGASVNAILSAPSKYYQGMMLIHIASSYGQAKILKFLLQKVQNQTTLERFVNSGVVIKNVRLKPLHMASIRLHSDTVKVLLESGAAHVDNTHHTEAGAGSVSFTTLHECVRMGASVTDELQKRNLSTIVSLLVEHGENQGVDVINVRENTKGLTPLVDAVEEGMLDIVRSMLIAGEKQPKLWKTTQVALDFTDGAGRAPLHVAARENRLDIAKLMMDIGANIFVRDRIGATPLHYAAREDRVEMVELLLNKSLDHSLPNTTQGLIGCTTNGGCTALHTAAYYGHVSVARILLRFGADSGASAKQCDQIHKQTAQECGEAPRFLCSTPLLIAREMAQRCQILPPPAVSQMAKSERCSRSEMLARSEMLRLLESRVIEDENNMDQAGVCLRKTEDLSSQADKPSSTTDEEVVLVNVSYHLSEKDILNRHSSGKDANLNTIETKVHRLRVYDMTDTENRTAVDKAYGPSQVMEARSGPLPIPGHVHAAGLHTSSLLSQPASSLLWQVERIKRQICTTSGTGSTRFWSEIFPLQTLAHRVRGKSDQDGNHGHRDLSTMAPTSKADLPLLSSILSAFESFLEQVKKAVLPVLGCHSLRELHCPIMGAYQRIEPDHYLGQVHRDFPGKDDLAFLKRHNASRTDSWNIWVLLSEQAWENPLVVFDPEPLKKRLGPNWETDNLLGWVDRPGSSDEWKAYTYFGMKAGDIIAWRTTRVPHAGGLRVPVLRKKASPINADPSFATFRQRQSIDFRCQCIAGF